MGNDMKNQVGAMEELESLTVRRRSKNGRKFFHYSDVEEGSCLAQPAFNPYELASRRHDRNSPSYIGDILR
ncbi:unnamed protein product [Sphenostylis stenocarpa]|uniref:Uncharacterized protein n=1 Tax=Sphenostylis stenocarpa TaxID=92480 RepID=A0AA86SF70_9FABA|nr:unnamed protein product [Sphenostylis stenocarpa]